MRPLKLAKKLRLLAWLHKQFKIRPKGGGLGAQNKKAISGKELSAKAFNANFLCKSSMQIFNANFRKAELALKESKRAVFFCRRANLKAEKICKLERKSQKAPRYSKWRLFKSLPPRPYPRTALCTFEKSPLLWGLRWRLRWHPPAPRPRLRQPPQSADFRRARMQSSKPK